MKTNIRFLNGRTFLEMEGKRIHSPAYTYLAERGDPKHPKQVIEQGMTYTAIRLVKTESNENRYANDK
ncbi:MAG: hypothetical protein WCS52_12145 [bacterium]